MLLYMFGNVMCSFITFLSRMECQASRIRLCHHTDDLSTISTLSKSIWCLWSIWCLANKEFSSNVAMAFVCSFTRAFSARDVWPTWTQSQSLHFILYTIPLEASFSILSFGFLSMLEMERMGLWATLMLKLRRTSVTQQIFGCPMGSQSAPS